MSFCMSALSLDVKMNYILVQYIETVTFIDCWCQINKLIFKVFFINLYNTEIKRVESVNSECL